MQLVGYHATEKNKADNIIKTRFSYDKRDDHWLGQGIYFFEELSDAQNWCAKNFLIIKVVLGTVDDKILNLDKTDQMNGFLLFIKNVSPLIDTYSMGNCHQNMCFWLDMYKESNDIDIIIHSFRKRNPLRRNGHIDEIENLVGKLGVFYKETQYCATNNSCIKEKNII